jgi:hypothetical protein
MRDADRDGRVVPDLEIVDGPIHTAWDLGHGSNMAVFAFQIGYDGLLVHDFIQEDGWFFTDYIEEVKKRGYTGKCYVPRDISVIGIGMTDLHGHWRTERRWSLTGA